MHGDGRSAGWRTKGMRGLPLLFSLLSVSLYPQDALPDDPAVLKIVLAAKDTALEAKDTALEAKDGELRAKDTALEAKDGELRAEKEAKAAMHAQVMALESE